MSGKKKTKAYAVKKLYNIEKYVLRVGVGEKNTKATVPKYEISDNEEMCKCFGK